MNQYKKIQRRLEKTARAVAEAMDYRIFTDFSLSHFLGKFNLSDKSLDGRTREGKFRKDLEKLYYKHQKTIIFLNKS